MFMHGQKIYCIFFSVPPQIWIPLSVLAEIFAVQNFWQVINAAVSGVPTANMEAKDLVRVYPAGRHGKKGQCLIQVRKRKQCTYAVDVGK